MTLRLSIDQIDGGSTTAEPAPSITTEPAWMLIPLVRRLLASYGSAWSSQVSAELTPIQFGMLNTLAHEPGVDQKTLGERLALDRSTITDVVTRLGKRGHIVRARDPRDARRNIVLLTPDGRALLEEFRPLVHRLRQSMVAGLPTDDQQTLVRILDEVVSTLTSLPDGRPAPTLDAQ